ncbi:hypothetical protein [Myxococcus sp. SDU36]|uniref:hypothetical protein n=1 Tax=Myxococcus sp. SDU36 TaxID=2831967 RepID=UPI00254374F1|nr:hypothetical protein [Myxococcus sp. SDU36]WIG98839.1 hypothetical protein KGD87_16430 [Myxococcus sp. SDU36]
MTEQRRSQGRFVLLFGATGTAGSGVLQACLEDPTVSEVRAITRRPLGASHPKLREVIWKDFAHFEGIAEEFRGVDCCLFCLGTSARNVAGEDAYREIHVAYPLAAARALLAESPSAAFVYLSGFLTKRGSWMMWARVKAEAEDALATLGFLRHANVRPTGVLPMHPEGAERWLLAPLARVFPSLTIDRVELGRAMLRLGLDNAWDGSHTLESSELKAIARGAPLPAATKGEPHASAS